jgi:signal transduction histidine kinase
VRRVANIVQAMKEFSHPGGDEKAPIDINHAIETTLTVARNEWKYVAEVKTEFDQSLPLVPCLAGEFNQVILNLVTNAAHAISDKNGNSGQTLGTITIRTRRADDWAEVQIEDTGCGVAERNRSRVFELFFTTKEVGRGTGQGLALAHTIIVKKHGGQIWFQSEEGKGTTFFVRLPLGKSEKAGELATAGVAGKA